MALVRTRGSAALASASLAVLLALTLPLARAQQATIASRAVAESIQSVLHNLNYARVLELAELTSSLGSRAPGYPGYERVLELIVGEARRLNLSYTVQSFTVLAPVECESYVEALEPVRVRLRAFSLWPHAGINAGPGLVEGQLVYVGKGSLEEMDGKLVNGSVVAMEYEGSGWNWLNALRLGAMAVVYLGGGSPEREAMSKFDPLAPLPLARVYLEPSEAEVLRSLLLKGPVRVRAHTDMELREVEGYNVLVEVPGAARPNEIIMVVAHFDSWCVALGLSNSTEEALSAALALELMRYFAANRPYRTLWILFTSGHWNGLAGPREFVRWFILQHPELLRGDRVIWCAVGLDISADLPTLSAVYVGHFYQTSGRTFIQTKFYWFIGAMNSYEPLVEEYLSEVGLPRSDGLRNVVRDLRYLRSIDLALGPEWMWSSTMSKPYVLNTEPFLVAGMAAFTLRTSYSFRPLEGEPASDLEYVRGRFWDRVVPQLASAAAVVAGFLSEPEVRVVKGFILPTRLHPLLYWGFLDLQVQVLRYNLTEGWYDAVPYTIVRVSRWSSYPFAWILVRADSNGTALVYGVTPQGLNSWYVEAWKPINSSWMLMPAWGMRSPGPTWITLLVPRGYATVYVQPLRASVLLDLYNPTLMRRALEDPRFGSANVWAGGGSWPAQFDTETGISPLYTYTASDDRTGAYLVGTSAVGRLTITLNVGGSKWPVGVAQLEGRPLWALDYATGTHAVATQRYSMLSAKEVRRLSAEVFLNYAREHIERALKAARGMRWSEAYGSALAAWSYSFRAYSSEIMPLYEECVRSAITLIPFIAVAAYFLERLLTKGEGFQMIFNVMGFEIALFLLFALTHPAFWVIPSTLLAALAIGFIVLTVAVLWIFYREASDIVSEVTAKLLGYHEVVTERTAATLMALSLSIENVRKRPLRSILTLVPIAVFAMAMVSLASLSPYTAVLPTPVENARMPFYGFVVKRMFSTLGDFMDYPSVEMLKAIVGNRGYVAPYVVYYSPATINLGPRAYLITHNSTATVPVVVGLAPEVAAALLSKAIVSGLPKPFLSDDQLAILLPSSLARALGVEVGDEVEFLGMKVIVTGILSEVVMDALRDPDGRSTAPIDSVYYPQLHGFAVPMGGAVTPQPYAWSRVVVMPSGVVRKLGGAVSKVYILLKPDVSETEFEELARRIAYAIDTLCYGGKEGGAATAYSKFPTYMAIGWEMMVVPFVLTPLSIVVSLLGSVKERSREIFTYSSMGLSPGGAMLMFIAEFSIYGFLGSTIGYFAGWTMSKILRSLGALPETLVFNYASAAISAVMALTLLSTLAAATYPAYIAARIVTPSLERKWKVPRAPRGTTWEIPLPFKVPTEREAQAILLYLQEYYLGAGYEKRFFRVTTDPKVDLKEKKLTFAVRLYPHDARTEQEVNFYFMGEVEGFRAGVNLRLLRGFGSVWSGPSPYSFINDMRKQLLLWGTLSSSKRAKYIEGLRGALGEEGGAMGSESASGEREPKG